MYETFETKKGICNLLPPRWCDSQEHLTV